MAFPSWTFLCGFQNIDLMFSCEPQLTNLCNIFFADISHNSQNTKLRFTYKSQPTNLCVLSFVNISHNDQNMNLRFSCELHPANLLLPMDLDILLTPKVILVIDSKCWNDLGHRFPQFFNFH
jgi:hypothetical protein